MYILGIESSCDETAASVAVDGRDIRSNVVSSQIEEHKLYGGVVPEIASRRHCENVLGVVRQALRDAEVTLEQIDAIAVTYAPGLIGALLVGVSFAKGLAMATGKPLVPVHHISGHIAANYIAHPSLEPPYLCLVASGGHSHIIEVRSHTEFRVIGRTRDDAAGECFDKCARVLGFPYPGGVHIDRAAREGNPEGYALPRPTVAGSAYDMSFSGLKTAALNLIHHAEQVGEELDIPSLCAAFSAAVSDTLVPRAVMALEQTGYRKIAVAGGVAANSRIRADILAAAEKLGAEVYLPPLHLCGDNGAMIGAQAYYEYKAGHVADMSLNAYATKSILGEAL